MTQIRHKNPKIALVYDRVNTKFGGAEQVLIQLMKLFPDAPLFTSVYDPDQANWAKKVNIQASFLQKIPFFKRFHRSLVMFMPLAFETMSFKGFDLVISITSAEAKGILTNPDQLHICYLLTPTRYLWSHQEEYQANWITGWFRKIIFQYLKWWDIVAANRPDVIVPISKLVKERANAFYSRESLPVIYPPVEVQPVKQDPKITDPYFLIVSRLVSYKRIDIAIEACQKLGQKLIIIGDGPDKGRLQNLVNNHSHQISFISSVQPDQIGAYYQNSIGFLAPAEEDFGIATIESLQFGKPVIVYYKSGAAELVQNGKTGILLMTQSASALIKAINQLIAHKWDQNKIQQSVAGQSAVQFQSQFKKMVNEQWLLFEKGYYD